MHSNYISFISLIPVLIWLYLLSARGGFWRMGRMAVVAKAQPQSKVRVAAVVPARNEADVVAQSVASLLNQKGIEMSVFLVDDGSTDGTAQATLQAAGALGKAESLTVIPGQELPAGWTGKMWAVQQGVERALRRSPDFLLLTDADIVHAPDQVATLVSIAARGSYSLVSLMVRLRCASVAEKLLIPAFVFFFFKLYPPAWIASARRCTAGAAGGCMLICPESLAKAGGIQAIRSEIIDDCSLARIVKRSGGSIFLGLGASSESVRPYGSFGEIGTMIARTAFKQLNHSALMLAGCLIGLTLMYLVPPLAIFSSGLAPRSLGILAWALMTMAYLPIVRFYGLNALWGLALPLNALFYMGATMYSALRFWSGGGGQWKGRAQDSCES